MKPALALVTAAAVARKPRAPRKPPTPESVINLSARLKRSGRVLSLDLAEKAKALAADALAVASLPVDAVPVGVRDDASRTAAALVAFAQRVERLAK